MVEAVVFELCVNGLAVITIDRPKALNAANVKMVRELRDALAKCSDGGVRAVLLQGAGDKGFCSGGDVKSLHGALTADAASEAPKEQMFQEYNAVYELSQLPVPSVVLAHGITMGFGLGLAVSARYSVATETSRFAMPENNIGLFPDAGFAHHAASRMPAGLGRLLALTGTHLIGAGDVLAARLATHFVPAEKLPALSEALRSADLAAGAEAAVLACLEGLAQPAPAPSLLVNENAYLVEWMAKRVNELGDLYALLDEATETSEPSWSQKLYSEVRKGSPFSQAVALRLLRLAEEDAAAGVPEPRRLALALERDFAAACRVPYRPDFVEGLRAVLVDKDQKPQWQPKCHQEVSKEAVAASIAPLPDGERVLGLLGA